MARAIETNMAKTRGLNFNTSIYPNSNGNYSPIVLEIEQLRERGLWANDPLITTQDDNKKKRYQEFFDQFYKIPLLKNFKLFEKRLYRWGWVGLIARFYGDKANYSLGFESRKVQAVNTDIDTNEILSIETVWYFTNDGNEYRVIETWDKTKVVRRLLLNRTSENIDTEEWNLTHPTNPIRNWDHNYGIVPVLAVANSLGENGQVINGFNNALNHIDELDRLNEEIRYETIATRSKTYYDIKAFTRRSLSGAASATTATAVVSENDILNQSIIGITFSNLMMGSSDSLNDKLKANLPVFLAQFDRSTLEPLLQQKEKKTTEIYSMLGFTNPNTPVQVVRTATEMEYYNESTASTLKALSLERSNTLRDFLELMIQIGIRSGYAGFDTSMTVDDLIVKCIPNLKTDENAYFDLNKKKADARLISFQEFKEIIDNSDKLAVQKWLEENKFFVSDTETIANINILTQTGLIDQGTLLKILFKGTLDESEIDEIIKKRTEEKPQGMEFGFDFDDRDLDLNDKNRKEKLEEEENE